MVNLLCAYERIKGSLRWIEATLCNFNTLVTDYYQSWYYTIYNRSRSKAHYDYSFAASGTSGWNSLPEYICCYDSLYSFQCQLKSYLFHSAFLLDLSMHMRNIGFSTNHVIRFAGVSVRHYFLPNMRISSFKSHFKISITLQLWIFLKFSSWWYSFSKIMSYMHIYLL